MSKNLRLLPVLCTIYGISFVALADPAGVNKSPTTYKESTGAILWQDPADIGSRDLFYGPGGQDHAPRSNVFKFVKEDTDGSNPKYNVVDADGVKWKVKLGQEVKPETVATRLVWAVGYFADEDYFMPTIRLTDVPAKLKRGRDQIGPDGTLANVRLERSRTHEKKLGEWKWDDNASTNSRELNGLRVMMALINNWDLKNMNNQVYQVGDNKEMVVTDLGATFGTNGFARTQKKSKGNLKSYADSKFITKVRPEYVNFATPGRPSLVWFYDFPAFFRRVHMEDLGKHVPRADAKWIGTLLGRLSHKQIDDAFRAAGYSAVESNQFTAVVERRIAALREL